MERSERRREELRQDGFNSIWYFDFGPRAEGRIAERRFYVPPGAGVGRIVFWAATEKGSVRFRVAGPTGEPVAGWRGRGGETNASPPLPPGQYTLTLDAESAANGAAFFAISGPAFPAAPLDAGACERPASPARGFYWPYLLWLPARARHPVLLVAPNNTGFPTVDPGTLRVFASNDLAWHKELAERLGCPLLVPMFPRPPLGETNLYLHALCRESLLTAVPEWRRVDQQLLAMVADARRVLDAKGVVMDDRVLLWGFSAAGEFANRFAMLHPRRVLAVAAGGVGWPIAPMRSTRATDLRYPVGLWDAATLTGEADDAAALRAPRWLLFRGADDTNEPLDFRDCFAAEDAALIRRLFGADATERWTHAATLYASAGLAARVVRYPGVGHSVTPEILEDVACFFEDALRGAAGDNLPEVR